MSPLRRQGLGLRRVSKANQIIKPNVVPVRFAALRSPACARRDKGKTRENVRNKRTKKLLSSWGLTPGPRFGLSIIMHQLDCHAFARNDKKFSQKFLVSFLYKPHKKNTRLGASFMGIIPIGLIYLGLHYLLMFHTCVLNHLYRYI